MKLTIIHESATRGGARQSFTSRELIRLGRHPDNDCVFDGEADRVVSAFHAEIRLADGRAFISDLDSTNGMLINGQWAEAAMLTSGDLVELGKSGPSFRVEFSGAPSDAPLEPTAPPADWLSQPTRGMPLTDARGREGVSPTQRIRFRSFPVSRAASPLPRHPPSGEPDEKPNKDKKYGERTVGMMIQNALAQAGLLKPKGTSKSTDYFEALVEDRVRTSSSVLKRVIVVSVIVLALAGAGLGIYLYRNRSVQVYQTTQVNYGDASGGTIAAANRYAVYLLAGQEIQSNGQPGPLAGFCTAFAVARDILATNAHCVHLAQSRYTRPMAIMNGAPANRYTIISLVTHPGYQPGRLSPDVGLLRVQGELPNLVTIASIGELGQVAAGVPMFQYGFPGRLNRVDAPEATFVKGDVGRVTNFDQKLGNFGENTLLQHSAYSSQGTSGSPIFNTSGHVIGINAGGYTEGGAPLAGYNFAMRIDMINTLLNRLGPG